MYSKEDFQEILQKNLSEIGQDYSKENAWKIFKVCQNSIVNAVLADEDNILSLGGIGRFEIIKAQPRSSKEGLVEYVPRLRWRPSSTIIEYIEEEMGQVPDPDKLAEAKAQLVKEGKIKINLPVRERVVEDKYPDGEPDCEFQEDPVEKKESVTPLKELPKEEVPKSLDKSLKKGVGKKKKDEFEDEF